MAEEEIIMEDKAIALEDTEESIVDDIQVSSMVDFVSENIKGQKIIEAMMKKDG